MKHIVPDDTIPARLDSFLADRLPELSRSSWKKLIRDEEVRVNGVAVPPKYSVTPKDIIEYSIPEKIPTKFKVETIYEDDDVLVINKPTGLLVHSTGGLKKEETLVDIFAGKLPKDGNRPGVVHRLDRDTSGVMILAKNTETLTYLQKQFQNRTVKKEYIAVCEGRLDELEFIVDAAIKRSIKNPGKFVVNTKGKPAQTKVVVLEESEKETLVQLMPKTGRTHQLRVHLKYIGHPIVGDRLYGKEADRLMLHANKLSIAIRHNDHKTFTCPKPKIFEL